MSKQLSTKPRQVHPEFTRMRGYRGWNMETHMDERERLHALATEAGFAWFDITELGRDKVAEERTIFAGLSLFVDHGISPPRARAVLPRAF